MKDLNQPCGRLRVESDNVSQGTSASTGKSIAHQKAAFLGNSTITASNDHHSMLYELLSKAQDTLRPLNHRTCGCSNFVSVFNNPNLEVPIVSDGKKHSFKNVTICGSVWSCPVCAYKIQSVRTNQMIEAMRKNRELGGSCVFLTLTYSHSRHDKLEDQLPEFSKALSKMKGWRGFKKACSDMGIHSKVRSLEVTYGEKNGWHPHTHEVYFSDRVLTVAEVKTLEDLIFKEWLKACSIIGLGAPSRRYGIKIEYMKSKEDDTKIGSYLCKFSHEVVMSGGKYEKQKDRYTPFSMLKSLCEKYNWRLANLYREYSKAFKGRRQLFGLSELLKKFDIEDISEELAAERGVIIDIVDVLSIAEFNSINYYKKKAAVIGLYDKLGKEAARKYIKKLCAQSVNRLTEINKERYEIKKSVIESTYIAMIREGLSEYV